MEDGGFAGAARVSHRGIEPAIVDRCLGDRAEQPVLDSGLGKVIECDMYVCGNPWSVLERLIACSFIDVYVRAFVSLIVFLSLKLGLGWLQSIFPGMGMSRFVNDVRNPGSSVIANVNNI